MAHGRQLADWARFSWLAASVAQMKGGDVDPDEINPYLAARGDFVRKVSERGSISDLKGFL